MLDEGRIVERGSHDELLAYGGYYAELERMQRLEAELEAMEPRPMSDAHDNTQHEDDILGKAYDARLARRLWSYVGDQKLKIALAVVLLILGAAAELAGPLLVKLAIDKYIAEKDWHGLRADHLRLHRPRLRRHGAALG